MFVLALCAATAWWLSSRDWESTDNAYVKTHITPLSLRVNGYIETLAMTDNLTVKQGDLLLKIRNDDYLGKVARARAQLTACDARLKTLETLKKFQLANIAQEHAGISSAQAEMERAGKDQKRLAQLNQSGYASQQLNDSALASAKQATAMLSKAQAAHLAAEQQLATMDEQVAEAGANRDKALAELRLAQLELDETTLFAPIAGTIGNLNAQQGQLLQPGIVVAQLIPASAPWIEANFKEIQIGDMHPGQHAIIELDAYPDIELQGHVDTIAPASGSEYSLLPPENATGNFTKIVRRVPVIIRLDNEKNIDLLKPGLSATVRVNTRH